MSTGFSTTNAVVAGNPKGVGAKNIGCVLEPHSAVDVAVRTCSVYLRFARSFMRRARARLQRGCCGALESHRL